MNLSHVSVRNANIDTTMKMTYDRYGFKPSMWCDKQWENLKTDSKG